MNSFLDWLDEAAGAFIRLAYLIAGITAVAVYFGAGTLPPVIDAGLNTGLPWVLAASVETHTYLTSRRVRAAWQERDWKGLFVNLLVLALLVAFSAWNQLGYLVGTWTPPHVGPLALPLWLAYGVRALVIPTAFMAAAFLAPLAAPITAQIEQEARNVLADVFKIARKQRRKMLREAEAAGRDMTGALVELVADDETRRIISHAYQAIRAPQGADVAPELTDEPDTTIRFEANTEHPTPAQDDTPASSPHEAVSSIAVSASTETPTDVDRSPEEPPDGPGGGLSRDATGEAPAPTPQAPMQLATARERRRPKPAAIKRRDKLAGEALENQRRARAFALLDADPTTTPNKIAQELHCGWRKAYHYVGAWQRRQASRGA